MLPIGTTVLSGCGSDMTTGIMVCPIASGNVRHFNGTRISEKMRIFVVENQVDGGTLDIVAVPIGTCLEGGCNSILGEPWTPCELMMTSHVGACSSPGRGGIEAGSSLPIAGGLCLDHRELVRVW